MNLPRATVPLLLATLSGVLYFVGFVGFDQFYLSFVCLVPLGLALRRVDGWKTALAVSWWMGFVTHLGGYYWVVHLLQTFAHLNLPLSVLGYLLLCIGQGATLAALGLLGWAISRRARVPMGVAMVVSLAATELAFPLLFPSYLANALAWTPLFSQAADLGGVILVSVVLGITNAGVEELIAARWEKRALVRWVPIAAASVFVANLGYGFLRISQVEAAEAAAPKLRTAIIQANVGAADKHLRAKEGIARFRSMTDEAMARDGMQLVVWPESGYNRSVKGVGQSLEGEVATQVQVPMIVGALRTERGPKGRKVWNSALAIAPGGEIVKTYDKIMLLAFGEYVPGDRIYPDIYKHLPYTSHFERGESLEPLPAGEYRLSANICYEDILPGLVRDLMGPIDASGTRPHAIVNVTNDSWYGPAEPPIHLALATFRSIEHRRWMIRSTATGISAFIDGAGRLVQKSGFETQETLQADVPMIAAGPTVYGLLGDWVGWLALLLSALGLAAPRLRRPAQAVTTGEAPPRAAA